MRSIRTNEINSAINFVALHSPHERTTKTTNRRRTGRRVYGKAPAPGTAAADTAPRKAAFQPAGTRPHSRPVAGRAGRRGTHIRAFAPEPERRQRGDDHAPPDHKRRGGYRRYSRQHRNGSAAMGRG